MSKVSIQYTIVYREDSWPNVVIMGKEYRLPSDNMTLMDIYHWLFDKNII